MTKKTIKIVLWWALLVIILIAIGWVVWEFTLDDTKGEENPVKIAVRTAYYKVALVIPTKSKPAVKLAVPYHRQQHNLSCEVASLVMALQYQGVKVTENELIAQLPSSDPGPRNPGNIWGDPNLGFVGNINGSMPNTGYGVYEQPIFDLANKYRAAKVIASGTLTDLITALTDNNPVVVWGVIGKGRDISWQTSAGLIIKAKMDEHARTLIGYTGTSDNPQLMILLDPIFGEIRMKVADFLTNWGKLDNKAVVVY
ncbi:MAG: C39 family peptidase [Patescibacteria group bacterium]|nr:C39 family peptidase [Patescibacteria group bacterium]